MKEPESPYRDNVNTLSRDSWRELTTRELSRDNKFLPVAAPTTYLWLLFLHGWNSDSHKARRARREAAYQAKDFSPAPASPRGQFSATASSTPKNIGFSHVHP